MRAAALPCALALAACCGLEARDTLEVREAGRSLYCNTPDAAARAAVLPDAAAVLAWQAARGVTLVEARDLAPAPYALVELGLRSTGGYGIEVSPGATRRGDVLVLEAVFTAPAPGSLRTQALTSPCVLLRLAPGRHAGIEVRDPSGALLARGAAPAPSAAGDPGR